MSKRRQRPPPVVRVRCGWLFYLRQAIMGLVEPMACVVLLLAMVAVGVSQQTFPPSQQPTYAISSRCIAAIADGITSCGTSAYACDLCLVELQKLGIQAAEQTNNGLESTQRQASFLAALRSQNCTTFPSGVVNTIIQSCVGDYFTNCEGSISVCRLDTTCDFCLYTGSTAASCGNTMAELVANCDCQETLSIDNYIIYATIAVGAVSVLGCLAVLLVTYSHNKDLKSLRHRVLVGVFFGNLLFSIANTIPYNVVGDDAVDCGLLTDPSSSRWCTAQAIWYAGKFVMGAFELFIVSASIQSLRSGSTSIPVAYEIAGHFLCVLCGVVVFVIFGTRCTALNDQLNSIQDDDLDMVYDADTSELSDLNSNLLRSWLVILFMVLLAWAWLRWSLARLRDQWDNASIVLDSVAERETREIDTHPALEKKYTIQRILLEKQKEGYMDIYKPLEPYIVVFVVFSVPAIVMATGYCEAQSDSSNAVSCDIVCEMILSARSLACVCVYFMDAHCRQELFHVWTLFYKAWKRLSWQVTSCCGCNGSKYHIRFNSVQNQVVEFSVDDYVHTLGSHEPRESTGSSVEYKLMTD